MTTLKTKIKAYHQMFTVCNTNIKKDKNKQVANTLKWFAFHNKRLRNVIYS